MKVAIINERAEETLGGAERSAFELADALRQNGLNVDLLAATGRKTENVKILCANKRTGRVGFYAFQKALKKHLEHNHYDIIHSFLPFDFADIYQPRGGSYPEAIIRNAASFQNKFIENFKRLTAFANFRRTTSLRAEKKLCRKKDGPVIAALSNYVAQQFIKHYGLDERRIVVIPNGVKTSRLPDAAAASQIRSQILSNFGLKNTENAVLFLFAANNFRLKGLSVLLEAFYLAMKKGTNSSSFLVVVGRRNNQKYFETAKNFGIEKNVAFLKPTDNLQTISAAADVAVLPTFYDPSSRFILEALSIGKPVITTKYNGATDLFSNNIHGKIIDQPENIEALAETIIYFTNKDNIQKASRAIAADNIAQQVSINRAVRQLISLYETILETKKR